ncbi:12044_t:CDS:1, partial [Acaulospora morrowiae]
MIESVKELTPTGKIKKPSYETVTGWINTSWNAVDIGLIRRAFKCYDISNDRNGTEDKLIFDYESLEISNQVNTNVEILENNNENIEEINLNSNIEDNYYNEQEKNYPN